MISQCNSHHQLRRALELVAEMRSRAVPLNVHTYSALLYVCLKANELDLSLDVYTQMLQEGCTPNLVTYNTLLDIYNKMGHWMDALNVLELLQHQVSLIRHSATVGCRECTHLSLTLLQHRSERASLPSHSTKSTTAWPDSRLLASQH